MNGTLSVTLTLTSLKITDVVVTDDTVSVDLEDGRTIAIPIGWYPRLAYGTPTERANFQISGSGYGIHWPDLDEDIGVEGLILGKRSTESSTSLARWLRRRKNTEAVASLNPDKNIPASTRRHDIMSDATQTLEAHTG